MKKILSLILALTMAVSLAACGSAEAPAEETTEGAAPKEIKFRRYDARTPSDHFPVKVVLYHD